MTVQTRLYPSVDLSTARIEAAMRRGRHMRAVAFAETFAALGAGLWKLAALPGRLVAESARMLDRRSVHAMPSTNAFIAANTSDGRSRCGA